MPSNVLLVPPTVSKRLVCVHKSFTEQLHSNRLSGISCFTIIHERSHLGVCFLGVDIHRDSEAVLPSKEKKNEHLIEQFYLCVYLFYWSSE